MRRCDAGLGLRQTYDAIIDLLSPSELAEDHLPGAINLPVLDDVQRDEVGILFVQRSKSSHDGSEPSEAPATSPIISMAH